MTGNTKEVGEVEEDIIKRIVALAQQATIAAIMMITTLTDKINGNNSNGDGHISNDNSNAGINSDDSNGSSGDGKNGGRNTLRQSQGVCPSAVVLV